MGARKSGRGQSQLSTAKDTLEKLKAFHALPGLLLEWRRISSALTKVVFPLQKEKVYCSRVSMYRIFGESSFHTATGRVTMCEPNLQNIPKDFEIQLPGIELYYTSGCCEFWYSVCFHVEINERTYLFFFFNLSRVTCRQIVHEVWNKFDVKSSLCYLFNLIVRFLSCFIEQKIF